MEIVPFFFDRERICGLFIVHCVCCVFLVCHHSSSSPVCGFREQTCRTVLYVLYLVGLVKVLYLRISLFRVSRKQSILRRTSLGDVTTVWTCIQRIVGSSALVRPKPETFASHMAVPCSVFLWARLACLRGLSVPYCVEFRCKKVELPIVYDTGTVLQAYAKTIVSLYSTPAKKNHVSCVLYGNHSP